MLRLLIILAIFTGAASASPAAPPTVVVGEINLSLDQQARLADLLTRRTRPLSNVNFPVAIGSVVPPEVVIEPLPVDAEQIAPEFRGFGYIVVEEQIAIVDQPQRRIAAVIQRGLRQKTRLFLSSKG